VAKTTTCANLGAGLALCGYRTLLIDFDPQASLTQYFGFKPLREKFPTVGDWIMNRVATEDVINKTKIEKLSLIPANENLKGDELEMLRNHFKSAKFLPNMVESIRNQFDFILIDTMPSFSLLFVNSLAACDSVLIPMKLEFLSMQGLNLLWAKVKEVQENIKPVNVLGVMGTFYRKGIRERESCLEELQKTLPQGTVLKTLIRDNTKVAEAAAHAKPIQIFAKASPGARDYECLTEEVLDRCQVERKKGKATVGAR